MTGLPRGCGALPAASDGLVLQEVCDGDGEDEGEAEHDQEC